jgi:hypothetical protein
MNICIRGFARIILMLAVLICFAGSQRLAAAPVGFGVHAGGTLAGQSYKAVSTDSKNSLIGFAGGAFTDLEIASPLSVQLEADFVMKGWQFETGNMPYYDSDTDTWGEENFIVTYRFNYLEIPLLLKAVFSVGRSPS